MSEDNQHDVPFVHEVQRVTINHIKSIAPDLQVVHYFSDGCAGQYKNFKNFLNLCHHAEDFGVKADWTFFATSHGKSPCDGLGGTVKRLTARASLQWPQENQILSTTAMFEFCKEQIPVVKFELLLKEDLQEVRKVQEERFKIGRTVPGTRGYHFFEPLTANQLRYKKTSYDPQFTGTFSFQELEMLTCVALTDLGIMQYVACTYQGFWWIGLVTDRSLEYDDVQVRFMHPHGPKRTFYWPAKEETCWVPSQEIISTVEAPTTRNGRMYNISNADYDKIMSNV